MARLDLDDLPPRVARELAALPAGEELLLVQGGAVVGRLVAADPPPAAGQGEAPDDTDMGEVLDQFRATIEDEF